VVDGSVAGAGIVAVALDMTESRQAEEALRVTESRLARTQEMAHLGSWERELDGVGNIDQRVAWWSAETYRIFGRDPSRGPPRFADFFEIVHPHDRAALRNAVERLAEEGAPFSIVLRVPQPGVPDRHVLAQATIVRDPDGQSARMLGTFLDITERHRLEEQVRHAEKMDAIGRLAGGIAHDFNHLLTVILGACEFLGDDLGPAGAPAAAIAEIRRAAQHATTLTHQLLAFGRQQVLRSHAIDPNELVADLAARLQHVAGERVCVTTRLADGVGMVRADRGQLEQVIIDLVAHARDTLPGGGTLTISSADAEITDAGAESFEPIEAGAYVALTLGDTGPGLDAHSLEHLFDPFFTARALGHGRGLGLSTAYGVVRQSGGHLLVGSTRGHGTTFTLLLPRIAGRRDPHDPVPPRAVPADRGGETVLVVEAEPAALAATHRMLRTAGYRVLGAPNGPEALLLAELHEGVIHLLLADLMMPGMGGVALARQLGKSRPSTNVIFLSGHTNGVPARRDAADEHVAVLQKPFTLDALQWQMRAVLDTA
jgi:signal transduction histidine kinase